MCIQVVWVCLHAHEGCTMHHHIVVEACWHMHHQHVSDSWHRNCLQLCSGQNERKQLLRQHHS